MKYTIWSIVCGASCHPVIQVILIIGVIWVIWVIRLILVVNFFQHRLLTDRQTHNISIYRYDSQTKTEMTKVVVLYLCLC